MGESKAYLDLPDMMSEIKGMKVLKSILPKKSFNRALVSLNHPVGTSQGSHDPIIFLALFLHMKMLIRMNINFFKFE